mmetsp:Transcript_108967/g.351821  ORF Transcript_108967/g.351821 Transcript_108967/m.351821 type:complete len:250 (-) Transcript_108967:322-1071(-)
MMKQRQASCRCCSSMSRALKSQLSTRPQARPACSRCRSSVCTSSSVWSSRRLSGSEATEPSDLRIWIMGSCSELKPCSTARSGSPSCSRVSASMGEVFMVMALSVASLSMTFSRSSVSLPKSVVSSSSSPASCSSEVEHLAAMCVTDLKIVEAMRFTPRSRFSSGRRTMLETEFDSSIEKPIIRRMMTTMSRMLQSASTRFCTRKLKMALRDPEAALTSSSFCGRLGFRPLRRLLAREPLPCSQETSKG